MSDKLSDKENLAYRHIVHYLSRHDTINNREVQALLGKSSATVRRYLHKMVACDLLVVSGENKARKYTLPTKVFL